MGAQGTLFDAEAAAREAEIGMERALRPEPAQEWSERADAWFELKDVGEEFTADDVVWAIGLPGGHNNSVGAWVNGKARRREIAFTGERRKSYRVPRHGGEQRVWVVL